MEKKPNITPTPWIQDGEFIVTKNPVVNTVIAKIAFNQNDDDSAIVTAVNCTYGANINPEKIQELIEAIENFKGYLPETAMTRKPHIKLQQALNNIKYKD